MTDNCLNETEVSVAELTKAQQLVEENDGKIYFVTNDNEKPAAKCLQEKEVSIGDLYKSQGIVMKNSNTILYVDKTESK